MLNKRKKGQIFPLQRKIKCQHYAKAHLGNGIYKCMRCGWRKNTWKYTAPRVNDNFIRMRRKLYGNIDEDTEGDEFKGHQDLY